MKNIKLSFLTTLFVGVYSITTLNSCGGGGGSSSEINGSINASTLKGVKICIKDKSYSCTFSDNNGKFSIKGFKAPQTLELFIGNSKLSEINASSESITITPKLLADNNASLASYIGTLLHKIGGCNLNATFCDLSNISNVDIDSNHNKSIIEELKSTLSTTQTVNFKIDNKNESINDADIAKYEIKNPDMVSKDTQFSGAASVGDFAKFSFDKEKNKLHYTVNGNIYGAKNGTKTLTNIFGNVFFKDESNNIYFFSGSLAVAQIPLGNNTSYIVGLQMPHISNINPSLFINKKFNFIKFSNNNQPQFNVIDINASESNSTNGTWQDINNISGTWEINGTHIDIKDNNGIKIANAIIRPSVQNSARAGFIIDFINGGFGIGVEAKPLQENELSGNFSYFDRSLNPSSRWKCYGNVSINGNSFTAEDKYCIGTDTSSNSGTLTLNPTVGGITYNGIAKISDTEYAFIDPESGYFISIDFSEPMISIGSNKPLKK